MAVDIPKVVYFANVFKLQKKNCFKSPAASLLSRTHVESKMLEAFDDPFDDIDGGQSLFYLVHPVLWNKPNPNPTPIPLTLLASFSSPVF